MQMFMDPSQPGLEPEALALDELMEHCMGNLEFVGRVLNTFQRKFGEDLAALEQAVATQDAAEAASTAHRIKGGAANVAARRLAAEAAQIESLARSGSTAGIAPRLGVLACEWDRFAEQLPVEDRSVRALV